MSVTTSISIREAREEDSPKIVPLLAELGYSVEVEFIRRQIRTMAEGRLGWMFIAVDGDAFAGLISYHQYPFYHMPGLYARITALVVMPEYRRQGIGSQLVAYTEQFTKAQGCLRLELNSANTRTGAHAFYEDLGYHNDAKRFVKPLS